MGFFVGLIVIGMLLIITIIILVACISIKEWKGVIMGSIVLIMLTIIEITIISEIPIVQPEPTAIDVYRGLTELEITSVNGVPTDTIVVFKK